MQLEIIHVRNYQKHSAVRAYSAYNKNQTKNKLTEVALVQIILCEESLQQNRDLLQVGVCSNVVLQKVAACETQVSLWGWWSSKLHTVAHESIVEVEAQFAAYKILKLRHWVL